MMTRPDSTEYAPYFSRYISLVPEGDIERTMEAQLGSTLEVLLALPEGMGGRTYAPGKWTIKQVLGHLTDTERILTYRALCISRNEKTPLPGYEPDAYVTHGDFNGRTLGGLIEEFAAVRRSSLQLFRNFTDEQWNRRATAGSNEISTRALAYIVAGHELHHMAVLKSRYLTAEAGA
jgi:hypothetical protein